MTLRAKQRRKETPLDPQSTDTILELGTATRLLALSVETIERLTQAGTGSAAADTIIHNVYIALVHDHRQLSEILLRLAKQ